MDWNKNKTIDTRLNLHLKQRLVESQEDLKLLKHNVLKYIQAQNNMAKRKSAYATHRVVGISIRERCHSKMAFSGIADKKFNTCSLGNVVGKL